MLILLYELLCLRTWMLLVAKHRFGPDSFVQVSYICKQRWQLIDYFSLYLILHLLHIMLLHMASSSEVQLEQLAV